MLPQLGFRVETLAAATVARPQLRRRRGFEIVRGTLPDRHQRAQFEVKQLQFERGSVTALGLAHVVYLVLAQLLVAVTRWRR